MISEAGQLQPDSAAIGIVQDSTSDGGWRVQMPERYQSITCRSLTGGHRAGDPVIVLLEPHESIPVILGPSPWRVVSEIAPSQIYWPGITPHDAALDIVDAVSAAAAVVEVAANYLARHARGHDLCSTADHYDVSGTPGDEDLLVYDGSTWSPAPAPAPAAQTIWARRLLTMGM